MKGQMCTGCRFWVHVKSKDCTDFSFYYCEKLKTRNYTKRKLFCGGKENEQ